MNENAAVFKPEDIVVELGGERYRLFYDLNCFCELEKIYDSVDSILQMLLGTSNVPDLTKVTYLDKPVTAMDVKIADIPLATYINKINRVREAKHSDTRNLLWAGCLHDHAIYNSFGEITGYSISKDKLGAQITFKNMREINAKIAAAILRDLLPSQEVKNAEAPEVVPEQEVQPHLVLRK